VISSAGNSPSCLGVLFKISARTRHDYSIRAAALFSCQSNPTNGSWWIVQILSTYKRLWNRLNPTNGSWWFVQVQTIH